MFMPPDSRLHLDPQDEYTHAPEAAGSNDELGGALNQEGFELIEAGEYESAVPILEEAVSAFSPGTEDVDYAYALFNLGNALRLSGRPEEAIPVLEQRLAIPNQTGVVRRPSPPPRFRAASYAPALSPPSAPKCRSSSPSSESRRSDSAAYAGTPAAPNSPVDPTARCHLGARSRGPRPAGLCPPLDRQFRERL